MTGDPSYFLHAGNVMVVPSRVVNVKPRRLFLCGGSIGITAPAFVSDNGDLPRLIFSGHYLLGAMDSSHPLHIWG